MVVSSLPRKESAMWQEAALVLSLLGLAAIYWVLRNEERLNERKDDS